MLFTMPELFLLHCVYILDEKVSLAKVEEDLKSGIVRLELKHIPEESASILEAYVNRSMYGEEILSIYVTDDGLRIIKFPDC